MDPTSWASASRFNSLEETSSAKAHSATTRSALLLVPDAHRIECRLLDSRPIPAGRSVLSPLHISRESWNRWLHICTLFPSGLLWDLGDDRLWFLAERIIRARTEALDADDCTLHYPGCMHRASLIDGGSLWPAWILLRLCASRTSTYLDTGYRTSKTLLVNRVLMLSTQRQVANLMVAGKLLARHDESR